MQVAIISCWRVATNVYDISRCVSPDETGWLVPPIALGVSAMRYNFVCFNEQVYLKVLEESQRSETL
ncbi:MAG: hypothetical protein ABSB41_19690 [Anaerolineales bacterium]|jgi:hypothetical protein